MIGLYFSLGTLPTWFLLVFFLLYVFCTAISICAVGFSPGSIEGILVDAVKTIAVKGTDKKWHVDLNNIQTVKKTGTSMGDTQLVKGLIIDKEPVHSAMPKVIKDCSKDANGTSRPYPS